MTTSITANLVFTFGEEETLKISQTEIFYDTDKGVYSLKRLNGDVLELADGTTILHGTVYAEQYENIEIFTCLQQEDLSKPRKDLENLRERILLAYERNVQHYHSVEREQKRTAQGDKIRDRMDNLGDCIYLLQQVEEKLLNC